MTNIVQFAVCLPQVETIFLVMTGKHPDNHFSNTDTSATGESNNSLAIPRPLNLINPVCCMYEMRSMHAGNKLVFGLFYGRGKNVLDLRVLEVIECRMKTSNQSGSRQSSTNWKLDCWKTILSETQRWFYSH